MSSAPEVYKAVLPKSGTPVGISPCEQTITMAAEKSPNSDAREGVASQPNNLSPSLSNESNLEHGKPRVGDHTDKDEEFTYEEQRKIVHRIDRRLVVILGKVGPCWIAVLQLTIGQA